MPVNRRVIDRYAIDVRELQPRRQQVMILRRNGLFAVRVTCADDHDRLAIAEQRARNDVMSAQNLGFFVVGLGVALPIGQAMQAHPSPRNRLAQAIADRRTDPEFRLPPNTKLVRLHAGHLTTAHATVGDGFVLCGSTIGETLLAIVAAAGGDQLEVELRCGDLASTTTVVQLLEARRLRGAKRGRSAA
jgi:hypothetical protein